MELSSNFFSNIYPGLENVAIGIFGSRYVHIISILYSSSSNASNIFYFLMHESRVIFIVLLLGILFYIDNIYGYWTAGGVALSNGDYSVYIIRYDRHVFSS